MPNPTNIWLTRATALLLGLGASTSTLYARPGDSVGNGGESVTIGGADQIFDQVEFDDALVPQAQGAAWSQVDTQLKTLATKLPATADYLRSFFLSGRTVWWFVKATLKPSMDGGPTNVVITVDKQQAALNTGDSIQISDTVWQGLNDEGKATLLMHEMLWSAVDPAYLRDGSAIRQLSRYLLRPDLGNFAGANVASFIQQFVGEAKSPLYRVVQLDIENTRTPPNLRVDNVEVGPLYYPVATVTAESPIKGLQLTTTRPVSSMVNIFAIGHDFVTTTSLGITNFDHNMAGICTGLQYAGAANWRLPTDVELRWLQSLNFLETKTISGPFFEHPTAHYKIPEMDVGEVYVFLNSTPDLTLLTGHLVGATGPDGTINYGGSYDNLPYVCVRSAK